MLQFIETNNILYDKQFGFRTGHSTNHAIITLVEKLHFCIVFYLNDCIICWIIITVISMLIIEHIV